MCHSVGAVRLCFLSPDRSAGVRLGLLHCSSSTPPSQTSYLKHAKHTGYCAVHWNSIQSGFPPRGCSDTLTPARLFKYKVLAKGVASSCKVVDLKRSSLLSVGWHHPSQADKCIHMHRVSILIHNSWNTWGKRAVRFFSCYTKSIFVAWSFCVYWVLPSDNTVEYAGFGSVGFINLYRMNSTAASGTMRYLFNHF